MRAIAKQYAAAFFLGFLGFSSALLFGGMSGNVMNPSPVLVALRYLSGGLMVAGLALWIANLRYEAGKAGLNTLLALLLLLGLLALFGNLIYPVSALVDVLQLGGLGLTVAALIIGSITMIVSPAYPTPPTVKWPEGGEPVKDQSEQHSQSH